MLMRGQKQYLWSSLRCPARCVGPCELVRDSFWTWIFCTRRANIYSEIVEDARSTPNVRRWPHRWRYFFNLVTQSSFGIHCWCGGFAHVAVRNYAFHATYCYKDLPVSMYRWDLLRSSREPMTGRAIAVQRNRIPKRPHAPLWPLKQWMRQVRSVFLISSIVTLQNLSSYLLMFALTSPSIFTPRQFPRYQCWLHKLCAAYAWAISAYLASHECRIIWIIHWTL